MQGTIEQTQQILQQGSIKPQNKQIVDLKNNFLISQSETKLVDIKTLNTAENPKEFLYDQLQFLETKLSNKILPNDTWRQEQLEILKKQLENAKSELISAIEQDFGRYSKDTQFYEIDPILDEVNITLKSFKYWIKETQNFPIFLFPSRSYRLYEPKGLVVVIGCANEPLRSILQPIISAIAAGNHVAVYPAYEAQYTSQALIKLLNGLDQNRIQVISKQNNLEDIISKQIDYVYVHSSEDICKKIAAKCLEFQIPCNTKVNYPNIAIVSNDADLNKALTCIYSARLSGSGQNMIGPDFIFVHETVYQDYLIKQRLMIQSSEQQANSEKYTKFIIVDQILYDQLNSLRQNISAKQFLENEFTFDTQTRTTGSIIYGYESFNRDFLANNQLRCPIFNIIKYSEIDQIASALEKQPLNNIYIFTQNQQLIKSVNSLFITDRISINDTMGQQIQSFLPKTNRITHILGAVNGIYGFKTFSNSKNVTEYGKRLLFAEGLLDLPVTQENMERYRIFRPLLRVKTRHVYAGVATLTAYGLIYTIFHKKR